MVNKRRFDIRRYFAGFILLIVSFSCSNDGVDETVQPPIGNEEEVDIYPIPPSGWMGEHDPYNTTGWVGDIMPYYENGKFHIFFLHDAQIKPAGKGFHDIHKFISSDLTSFSYKGRMIGYGSENDPDFATGTGSTIKIGDTYYFYYTGHNGISGFLQDHPRESVLLAKSKDLKNWDKEEGFILTAPKGYYDFDFRDPHVFFNSEKNEYWMLVSTQTSARKAVLLLFTTKDPRTNEWEPQGPLYKDEDYLMMECSDIFKMGDYWYLFFSENWGFKGTHYRIANSSSGPWIEPENDVLDGEFFYAAKTATNGNKRYLFGWTARRLPETNSGTKQWAGNMVVHELVQFSDGTLGVKPIEAVSMIFDKHVPLNTEKKLGDVSGSNGTFQLNGSQSPASYTFSALDGSIKIVADVSFENGTGSTGFMFGNSSESAYKIMLEPEKSRIAAYMGGTMITHVPMVFQTGDSYHIDIFVEGSICVVYIDGKVALSNRFYGIENKQWGIIAHGTAASYEGMEILKP